MPEWRALTVAAVLTPAGTPSAVTTSELVATSTAAPGSAATIAATIANPE